MHGHGSTDKLPFWSAHQAWALVGATLACVAAIAGALILEADGFHRAAVLLVVAAGLFATLFFARSWQLGIRLRGELRRLQRRYDEVYGRAGISIWQEDWTAVGLAVDRLRGVGVSDIAGWYAERPEEARALHGKVVITGVNDYSVKQMRAQSEEQLLGSLSEVLPGSFASFGRWLEALTRGENVYLGESVIQRRDGTSFDCFVTAALPRDPAGYAEIIVSIVDISAYKADQLRLVEAREDMARTQRIATVGALTASIAHEVNSPLAAISANASACLRWLRRETPDMDEAEAAASAVLVETDRARAVIDRTRAYLAKAERCHEPADLRTLIMEAARLVEREAHAHEINVVLDIADNLGILPCDAIQLQQVLVNLMVNAIQAMNGAPLPRQLIVRARRGQNMVTIDVEDSGPGIAEGHLHRIFEPFYSTKQNGMGMGLAICRTAVESYGGSLATIGKPGEGAWFQLLLPTEAK